MSSLDNITSLLFVPADRIDRLPKAIATVAGGIILDLEDGVAEDAKAAARVAIPQAIASLRDSKKISIIRINAGHEGDKDIAAFKVCPPDVVMLPKVERPDQIAALVSKLQANAPQESTNIVALIETPLGVLAASEIARCSTSVIGLAFGSEDFALSMGVKPGREELAFAAGQISLAARAHLRAAFGVIGSIAEIQDEAAFSESCLRGQRAGFTGALAIHPKQVEIAHRVFAPSSEDVSWATAVIEDASKTTAGAFRGRDGRMVDRPVLDRARRILERFRG